MPTLTTFPFIPFRYLGVFMCELTQRGGRHEAFLNQLANNFHVRAMENPAHADDLRMRVDAGEDWTEVEYDNLGEQHREGVGKLSENPLVGEATCCGSAADRTERVNVRGSDGGERDHSNGGSDNNAGKNCCRGIKGCRSHEGGCCCTPKRQGGTCSTTIVGKEGVGSRKGEQSTSCDCVCSCPSYRGDVNDVRKRKEEWSYELSGDLGTVLAFAARRRGNIPEKVLR